MFDLLPYPGIDLKCMSFLTDFTPYNRQNKEFQAI